MGFVWGGGKGVRGDSDKVIDMDMYKVEGVRIKTA